MAVGFQSGQKQSGQAGSIPAMAQPHGGALRRAAAAYPDAAKPWVDLSTGINPYPWPWPKPLPEPPTDTLTRLPEPEDQARLEANAARNYGVADPSMVTAAPGTQALISLLPRLFPARKVAVIGPTYSEHAIAWGAGGRQVEVIASLEEVTNHDVLVAVNPNNPDGLLIPPEQLVSHMAGRGMVIVDEAFADLEGRALSVIPHLGQHDVIVLRSFGKSYGLAGLRLGFAVARTDLALHIRQALGPWAVSGPALHIGTDALNDQGWSARMSGQLAAEANRLDLVLRRSGLRVVGGTRLFRLAYHDDAHAIFHRLCQAGILVRKFDDRPKLLRFGIPTAEDRDRLEAALLSGR